MEEEQNTSLLTSTSSLTRCLSLPSLAPVNTPPPLQPATSLLLPTTPDVGTCSQPGKPQQPPQTSEPRHPLEHRKRRRRRTYVKYGLVLLCLVAMAGWMMWAALQLLEGSRTPVLDYSSLEARDRGVCGRPLVVEGVERLGGRAKRVVGGTEANYSAWPWMVSLSKSPYFRHHCGATILSRRWLVTAAHCVEHFTPRNVSLLRVRLGEHHLHHTEEALPHMELDIARAVIHPAFNSTYYFTSGFNLFQANIVPICLPDHSSQIEGQEGWVTGWGARASGGGPSSVLRTVELPIMDNIDCILMFNESGKRHWIGPEFLCAGRSEGGRDACNGDSGGPLVIKGEGDRWQLAGISSWGNDCGARNRPGVFTRVSLFTPWILEVAGGSQYGDFKSRYR